MQVSSPSHTSLPHIDPTSCLLQIYTEKLLHDLKEEEFLLGGLVCSRVPLSSVMYDFFMSRYGTRQATDVMLSAFLKVNPHKQ